MNDFGGFIWMLVKVVGFILLMLCLVIIEYWYIFVGIFLGIFVIFLFVTIKK